MIKVLAIVWICVIGLSNVYFVEGYKDGAPLEQCESMTPQHGFRPQTSRPPYQILITDHYVRGGEEVRLRLAGLTEFKGFLVKAKNIDNYGEDDGTDTGSFIISDHGSSLNTKEIKYLDCFGRPNSGVTHASNTQTKSVELKWIPPNIAGKYIILGTFVKEKSTYWTNVASNSEITVSFNPSYNRTSSAYKSNYEKGEHEEFSEEAFYDECGINTGCVGYPQDCISDRICEMFTSWKYDHDSDEFLFTIGGELPWLEQTKPIDGHISSALSFDNKMGQDIVVGCVLKNGEPYVKSYFNIPNDKQNSMFKDENYGFGKSFLKTANYENGFLVCQVSRPSFIPDSSEKELHANFNLKDDEYFILMARSMSIGVNDRNKREKLGYHTDTPHNTVVSKTSYKLTPPYKTSVNSKPQVTSTYPPGKTSSSSNSFVSRNGFEQSSTILFLIFLLSTNVIH